MGMQPTLGFMQVGLDKQTAANCKARLRFGMNKQLSTLVLNFNNRIKTGSGSSKRITIPNLHKALFVIANGMTTETQHINSVTKELLDNGFLHLTDQTEEQLNELINSLGQVIFTTDVVVKPESKGMVTSARGLDYHTDHHKAKYIIWYCYKQTDLGGDSILMDANKIYEQLSDDHKQQLTAIELFEHKIFPDDKESYPFVATDENGKRKFYYSFWLVKNEDKQNPAMLEFQRLIKQTEQIRLNLKERDILVVDNHRIFHGRTPIEGSKDRFLKRFWLTANNS